MGRPQDKYLIPLTERSEEEAHAIRSKGGKATQETRKRRTEQHYLISKYAGVPINDVSTHLYTQAQFRGPNADGIVDALTNPLKIRNIRADMSQQFIGEYATVAINVKTGKVITCWQTGSKTVEKLKAKGGAKP